MAKITINRTNSLALARPDLLAEWNWERNAELGLDPYKVTYGSNKKVWWKCSKNQEHFWEDTPAHRSSGRGCSICWAENRNKRIVASAASRKKSPADFAREASERNEHVVVVSEYVNAKTQVEVECVYCGERYMAFPGNVLKGTKHKTCRHMDQRITMEEFVHRLAEDNPTVELVGNYTQANAYATFRCVTCGNVWSAWAASVLRGCGCPSPECVSKKIADARTKTHDEFVRELAVAKPDIEVLGTYINSNTSIEVRCRVCGYKWDADPSHLLHDTGCPKCAGNLRYDQDSFVEQVAKYHPTVEVLGTYTRSKDRIHVRCKVCGHEWDPEAGNLSAPTSTGGCLKCAGNMRKTTEQLAQELVDAGRNIRPIGEYVNAFTPIQFLCLDCGEEFTNNPHSVLQGTGCPTCSVQQTSFFEKVIYFALTKALGPDAVIARSTNAIGMELDIYVPSMHLAFEPGAWFYHKDKGDRDAEKYRKCTEHGIRLHGIYTGCPADATLPVGYVGVSDSFGVSQWARVREYVAALMESVGVDASAVNWKQVFDEAVAYSGRRTTASFISEMAEINPDVRILGEYIGARERVKTECRRCGRVWYPFAESLLHGHDCRCDMGGARRKPVASKGQLQLDLSA